MIPYRIETLFQYEPWANKALFGVTIATSLALELGVFPEEAVREYFIWGDGGPLALLGYMFAHGGILHLAGNMVFLWVFGNAVCATIGSWLYLGLYLGLGAFAGLVHQLVGGEPVVGASGAITGVVGLAVAFYPVNRVNLYYSLGLVPRTGRVGLWLIALYWTFWDVVGALFHLGAVAYWAHLGGTAAGLASGLLLLWTGRVRLTEFDHGSLLDFLLRREPSHKLKPTSFEALADIRRAELAFAAAQPAPSPEVRLGPPAAVAPPRESTIAVSPHGPAVRLAGGVPADASGGRTADPAAGRRAPPTSARALPEVRYFYFDGQERRGPLSRGDFLRAVSQAPETAQYWFWAEGMPEWRPLADLPALAAGSPAPSAD